MGQLKKSKVFEDFGRISHCCHLPGKPGKVRKFERDPWKSGNLRQNFKSQRSLLSEIPFSQFEDPNFENFLSP